MEGIRVDTINETYLWAPLLVMLPAVFLGYMLLTYSRYVWQMIYYVH